MCSSARGTVHVQTGAVPHRHTLPPAHALDLQALPPSLRLAHNCVCTCVCVCVCVLVVGRQTLSMWDNVRRGEHTWIFPHQVPLGAFLPACLSLLVAAVAPLERRKAETTRLSPQIGASNAAGFCKDGGARRHGVRDQRLKKSPCACRHACSCRAGVSTPNSRRPSVQSVEHLC